MRIVTRPDFDGVVCASLLYDILDITEPTCWISAASVQSGEWQAKSGDVIANLPYHDNCSLWFDHHASNSINKSYEGKFDVVPSAARVIFEYYKGEFSRDYTELVDATDRIDSAQLTMNEILHPASNPYFLLSITLEEHYSGGDLYWNKVVQLLRNTPIHDISKDDAVSKRCTDVFDDHDSFQKQLEEHTIMDGAVSITDFRKLKVAPDGNRFLIYCLFPDCITNVKISNCNTNVALSRCSVGHNIFKRECNVSAGELLQRYDGGGHFGAGGANLDSKKCDESVADIVQVLNKNVSL